MEIDSEVRWGYRYYLGREAECSNSVRYHAERAGSDPGAIRASLFESEEAKAIGIGPQVPSRFCIWRPGAPRIAVIGNCNGPDLGRVLAATTELSVMAIDVVNLTPAIADVFAVLDDADYIISIILGPDFGPLSLSPLRARYGSRLATHPPLYFEGIHPDIINLGARGQRLYSGAVDYHSRFVLRSYLSGVSVEACRADYLARIIEDLPERFHRSGQQFMAREAAADLRVGEWLISEVRRQPLLYTINHPGPPLLVALAAEACRHFGVGYRSSSAPMMGNQLARDIIWPVHDVVARELGLSYHTSDVFFMHGTMLTLDEFIWRTYAVYRRQDQDLLVEAAAARGLHPAGIPVAPDAASPAA